MNAAGHVTANVIATGRSGGGRSSINYVNIFNGSTLYGNLTASTGVVGIVTITGNVGGTPGSVPVQPSIYARDGIRKVVSENFYGTLSSPSSTTVGNLQRLEVANNFAGSIDVQNLTMVNPAETLRGIVIGGDLSGTMNSAAGSSRPSPSRNSQRAGAVRGRHLDRPPSDPDRDTDISPYGAFGPSRSVHHHGQHGRPPDHRRTAGRNHDPGLDGGEHPAGRADRLHVHHRPADGARAAHDRPVHQPLGRPGPGHTHPHGLDLLGGINLPTGGLKGEIYINGDLPTTPARGRLP